MEGGEYVAMYEHMASLYRMRRGEMQVADSSKDVVVCLEPGSMVL